MNYRVWGIPAVLPRGIAGKALRAFPGSFGNLSGFFPEIRSRTGGMAHLRPIPLFVRDGELAALLNSFLGTVICPR